jgi:murein DD-endopeptidase MepM/ murein hydrolase activator NlpD
VSSYTFSNVITGHTIAASFALDTFTISASAGAGGTISPSGAVPVNYGSDQGFSITANTGYHIADVTVDGVSQGAVSSYNFSAVTANHTIAASFALDTFTITASAGGGGSISPSGAVSVNYGSSQGFSITAITGYHIADVTVDGVSQGAVSSYNFSTVTANHTIAASFAPDTCTITASAGAGGNISPTGTVLVNYGGSQTFYIIPNSGYYVTNVLVDGVSVGAVTSYTFNNVISNHTITASFASGTATITASAGPGGTISPSGTVSVNYGSSRNFTITPNKGFHVADVLVDGSSVGARTHYTFNNVTTNHTIEARFAMSLAFPLPGYTAATAPVSAVMDNSVLERTPIQFYVPGNVIKAFNGETGEKQYGVTYLDPYGKYWPAYKNSSGTSFFPPNGLGVRPLNYLNGPYLSYAGNPGYNYQVPQGTPVLATGDGKLYAAVTDPVNGAGYSYYYNSYIDHQNGYYSWYLYAPLTSDILAQIKQNGYAQVTTGQVIGQTLGDHLHFEVRLNGFDNANVVDPYKLGLWLSTTPVTNKALPWLQLLLQN